MNDLRARAYLTEHGISEDTAEAAGLYVDNNRLWFPFQDEDGNTVYKTGRDLSGNAEARWLQEGTRPALYASPGAWEAGLSHDPDTEELVALVEGPPDALALASAGIPAFATCGNRLSTEAAQLLSGRTFVVIPDNDDGGKELETTAVDQLLYRCPFLWVSALPGEYKDVAEFIGRESSEIAKDVLLKRKVWIDQRGGRTLVPRWDLPAVLTAITEFVNRYVVLGDHNAAIAVALWIAHTHVVGTTDVTPYLAITSAEKQSGKTRLLEVMETLVHKPWRAVTPSEAVLFRMIDRDHPTLLLDETDAMFAKGREFEGLRAVLNSGYKKGARVPRANDKGKGLDEYDVFGPKAFAGIGHLPETIADRSIPIKMMRRARGEGVERFYERDAKAEAAPLKRALEQELSKATTFLTSHRPGLPEQLTDRQAEVWEPLLAIADAAGPLWACEARQAAIALHTAPAAESLGLVLLRHIRDAFDDAHVDRMTTEELLRELVDRDDGPWVKWWGHAVARGESDLKIAARSLANNLKPFEVKPSPIRFGDHISRGYRRQDFESVWDRWVPERYVTEISDATENSPSTCGVTSVTSVTSNREVDQCAEGEEDAEYVSPLHVTNVTNVTNKQEHASDLGFSFPEAVTSSPNGDATDVTPMP